MASKQKFSTIFLLFVARALRGFGDGFAIIVLPALILFPAGYVMFSLPCSPGME